MQVNFSLDRKESQELEKQWRKNQSRYSHRELTEIFAPQAENFLEQRLLRYKIYLDSMRKIVGEEMRQINGLKDEFSRWFWQEVLREVGNGNLLLFCEKEIKRINTYLIHEKTANSRSGVSDEEVERAKENLEGALEICGIKPDKNGMAKCFNHDDKRPSLLCKNGYCYCFSEQKSWDSIQLLMDITGCDFVSAVKRLN